MHSSLYPKENVEYTLNHPKQILEDQGVQALLWIQETNKEGILVFSISCIKTVFVLFF